MTGPVGVLAVANDAGLIRQLSYDQGYNSTEAQAMCAVADRIEAKDRLIADLLALTPASVGYDMSAVYAALDELQQRAAKAVQS